MTVVGDVEVDVKFLTEKGEAALAAKLKTLGDGSGVSAPKIPKPDTKDAEAGLDKFSKLASSKLQSIAGSSSSLVRNFGDVEKAGFSLGGLAGPLGLVTAGVAALGAATIGSASGFSSYAEQVRQFSVTSGLGAEQSSRFVSALDRLGGSAEKARGAFFFLSRNVDANTPALQRHAELIVRNSSGAVDLTRTFLKAADAIHSTADAQERNAIAAALFGRQARDLVPTLALGSDAIQRQLDLTDRLGLTIDEAGIQKAREFSIATKTLGQSMKGLEIEVGGAVVPALSKLEYAFSRVVSAAHNPKDFGAMFSEFGKGLTKGNILQALEALGKAQYDDAASANADAMAHEDAATASVNAAQGLLNLVDAQQAAKGAATRLYQAQLKVNDVQAQIAELQKGGGDAAKKLAAAQDELRSAYERLEDVQHKIDDSTVSITQKQSDLADAMLRFGPASHQALDAQKALNDAVFDQHRATEDLADAKKKVGDASANEKDIRSNEKTRELADLNSQLATAQGDVADASDAVVRAQASVTGAMEEAGGATLDARDKVDILRDAYKKFADTLAPGSPLRNNIEDTIAELNQLDQPTGNSGAAGVTSIVGRTVTGPDAASVPPPLTGSAAVTSIVAGAAGVNITVNAAPQQSPQQIAASIGFDLARRATPLAPQAPLGAGGTSTTAAPR